MESDKNSGKRICQQCGKPFVPRTRAQYFCSSRCGDLAKDKAERERIKVSRAIEARKQDQAGLTGKQSLSITDASLLLNVSRPTIYKLIEEGKLSPIRLTKRTIRIPIEQLKPLQDQSPQPLNPEESSVISLQDALTRFGVTKAWLYEKAKRHGIKSTLVGGKAFFPKKDLERIFPPKSAYDRKQWYTMDELEAAHNLSEKRVLTIIGQHSIPTQMVGRLRLVSRKEWDQARKTIGKLDRYYLSRQDALKYYHISNNTFIDKTKGLELEFVNSGHFKYYKKKDLDALFKDKTPKIPKEIRRDYMRGKDALKHYHITQQTFLDYTKAAQVTKVKTEGRFVWYKKSELDRLFKKP